LVLVIQNFDPNRGSNLVFIDGSFKKK